MKNFALILSLSSLLLVSCTSRTIKVDNQFQLTVPSSLTDTKDLNDVASLQAENQLRDVYVIVIEDSINEFSQSLIDNEIDSLYSDGLEGFTRLLVESANSDFENPKISTPIPMEINGLKAIQVEMEFTNDESVIYWCPTYIQGKNHYYQLIWWTLKENKQKNEAMMKKVVASFKELK